jgi:hypothetical protein
MVDSQKSYLLLSIHWLIQYLNKRENILAYNLSKKQIISRENGFAILTTEEVKYYALKERY